MICRRRSAARKGSSSPSRTSRAAPSRTRVALDPVLAQLDDIDAVLARQRRAWLTVRLDARAGGATDAVLARFGLARGGAHGPRDLQPHRSPAVARRARVAEAQRRLLRRRADADRGA